MFYFLVIVINNQAIVESESSLNFMFVIVSALSWLFTNDVVGLFVEELLYEQSAVNIKMLIIFCSVVIILVLMFFGLASGGIPAIKLLEVLPFV